MIQLASISELKKEDIPNLVNLITPELNKKKKLYQRYARKANDINIIGENQKTVKVAFEKYIIDNASGYLGGKEPSYEVEATENEQKRNLLKKVLKKVFSDKDYKDSMQILINHIVDYNDDGNENYQLVKDILITGTCYEILYENKQNETVYSRVDPLQTQAIWDYSVPRNLIGVVGMYEEKDINGKTRNVVSITDRIGTRIFKGLGGDYEEVIEKDEEGKRLYNNHNWGDVPYAVVEIPDGIAICEPVFSIIDAYEELVQGLKETFKYNNNAKLKITGYRPQDPLLIKNEQGVEVENPTRKKHDEALLKAPIFYTPDDGDIDWIIKQVDDGATQNTLKTYIDLIMMITGVPQTTDLGFTKADNASAIDRKFFSLEQTTTQAMQLLKMAYKRRWELIFNRLSIKGAKYDFRDIKITLNKNLPANENEVIDMYMKLRGLVSDETIIDRLPLNLDSVSEMSKMEEQEEAELDKEVEKVTAFNNVSNGEKTAKPEDKTAKKQQKENKEKVEK